MRAFSDTFYCSNGFFRVILFIGPGCRVPATPRAISGILGARKHPVSAMTAAF